MRNLEGRSRPMSATLTTKRKSARDRPHDVAASDMSEVKRCRGNQVKSSQVKTSPIVKLILALCERHGTLPTPGPVSLVSIFIGFCRSLSVQALLVRLVAPIRSRFRQARAGAFRTANSCSLLAQPQASMQAS